MENKKMQKGGEKNKADIVKLEEILERRGLLTKESIVKDILENEKVGQIGKIILATVFVSGAVAVSAAAPGVLGAAAAVVKLFRSSERQKLSKAQRQRMMKTIYNLRKNKLIEWDEDGDKIILKITPRGHSIFIKRRINTLRIKRQKKWDKIWRIVIFDIPNNLSPQRDAFRQRLKSMGFYQFQKSAFITPFPCQQELEAILEYHELFDYVTYLEAFRVSGEDRCRRYFSL